MNKIVLSVIVAIALCVGVYHITLLAGASHQQAAFFLAALVVALTLTVVGGALVDAVAGGVAAIAAFAAALVPATDLVAIFAFAALVVACSFGVVAIFAEEFAKELGVSYRWALAPYTLEVVAIFTALIVGSPMWSVAIVASGVLALLKLRRLYQSTHRRGMTEAATLAQ